MMNPQRLFNWYQQLVAKLGKNKLGILPIVSNMPKIIIVLCNYLVDFKIIFLHFFCKRKKIWQN